MYRGETIVTKTHYSGVNKTKLKKHVNNYMTKMRTIRSVGYTLKLL